MTLFFTKVDGQETSPQFIQGNDTLVVYRDVPGLTPSDKYTIRVKSVATNGNWIDVFAHYTYNRAAELGGVSVPKTNGTTLNTTVYNYAKHTSAWSHTYGNIEISPNTPVEVEIATKVGFKVRNLDVFKATVHPAQKASVATLSNGKIYFTVSNPGQLVIDINGQMDDFNAAINGGIGAPVHAISIFVNPVIKKPTLNNLRTYYVEPTTTRTTLDNVLPDTFDTIYFKPGVHDLGKDIKIYPGKVVYIPGDALIYGNLNNLGVPNGGFSKNGENIRIFGYGTISGAKIPHNDYVLNPTGSYKGFEIENGLNWKCEGITNVDSPNHSVYTIGGSNGLFNWVKVITWRANGDGIGGYEPALNCFIRTQDDCSYAKGYKKNCTFWKDANAALFHLATITENMTEPLIMEDCDVIYARLRDAVGNTGGGFQQRGEGTAGQRNINVIFRNIRVHDKLTNMSIINLVSYQGSNANAPTVVGSSYKGFLFQNISIAGMAPNNKQRILGCAAAPWYGGLVFDNLTIGGVKVTKENHQTYFNTNEFVKYLLFEIPKDVTLTTIADPIRGSITRNPNQTTYLETSTVTLSAKGKPGYIFLNWTGDITGTTNPIDVVVDKDMTITANFGDPDFSKPISIAAPGSGSFVIPAGVISVTAKIWGAGGAGGSASNGATALQSRGGGGAGGGFATVTRSVTAGQVLSYSLGAGGIAAPLGFANNSVDPYQHGGNTTVNLDTDVIAFAQGGQGGTNIAGAFASGSGGIAPKTNNIGGVVFYGGNGGIANSSSTGSGGGSAGADGNGGNATMGSSAGGVAGLNGGAVGGNGINSTNVGNPGGIPGAGGSGAAVRASANNSRKGGDGADGAVSFTFIVTPIFTSTQVSYCLGDVLPSLPTTSNNGIAGTWSPALNNIATTVYTFTPTEGQSAISATMTITINPIVIPTFTAVAPICSGGSLLALPTTSNNGITGTWSPAIDNTVTTEYTFTPTAGLCATTATITITVITPTINSTSISACGSYTWEKTGTTYSTSGVYTGTTINCVTENLDLTITPSSNTTTTVISLNSYIWSVTGQNYTTSGIKTGPTTNCVTELLDLTITTTEIPTGSLMFCKGATVATAVGSTSLKFYSKLTGGTPLVGTTALATKTLFVTETINSVESSPRVAISVIVNPLPATPTSVTSPDAKVICKYIGTSNPVAFNATGGTVYNWTVPAGAIILTGYGTTDITVSFAGAIAIPGLIGSVTARAVDTNSCISLPKSLVLTTKLPSKPIALVLSNSGILSGGSIKKVGPYMGTETVFTLTASEVASADHYRWELPAGVNQLSGGTENIITVDFADVAPEVGPLTINVYSVGGCGESAMARTLNLARMLPTSPTKLVLTDDAISTSASVTSVGLYTAKLTALTLTATPVTTLGAKATSFSWVLPSGVTVTAGATHVADNGTTKTYSGTATVLTINLGGIGTGVLSVPMNVFAVNGTGTSVKARTLTVTSAAPAKPGAITVTGYNVCNAEFTAQVANVPGVDYAWSVSTGIITSGQGTNSITINPGAATVVTITVIGSNGTGVSTARIHAVKKSILPCKLAPADVVADDFNVIAYPNPSSTEFTIETSRKGATIRVYDVVGRLIENRQSNTNSVQVGRNYATGVYNVIVNQGTKVKTLRVIKR